MYWGFGESDTLAWALGTWISAYNFPCEHSRRLRAPSPRLSRDPASSHSVCASHDADFPRCWCKITAGATLQCSQWWRQLLSEHSGFLPGYGYGCVFLEPASRSQRKPRFWSMALGSTLWELKSWMASLVLVVCKPLNTMKEIFWCFSELEIYSMQLNPDGCTILLITNCREKS